MAFLIWAFWGKKVSWLTMGKEGLTGINQNLLKLRQAKVKLQKGIM